MWPGMITYLPYVLQCTPETLLDDDTPIYPGVKKGDGVNNDCDSAEGEEINNGLGMNWAHQRKTCLWWFSNNKGADQPAHPRSLISVFVIRLFESIISGHATSKISLF